MTPDELAKQIPDEVVEAAAIAGYQKSTSKAWEKAGYINQQNWRRAALADLAAGLAVWPGMSQLAENDSASIRGVAVLILPLPEATNDKGDANV